MFQLRVIVTPNIDVFVCLSFCPCYLYLIKYSYSEEMGYIYKPSKEPNIIKGQTYRRTKVLKFFNQPVSLFLNNDFQVLKGFNFLIFFFLYTFSLCVFAMWWKYIYWIFLYQQVWQYPLKQSSKTRRQNITTRIKKIKSKRTYLNF